MTAPGVVRGSPGGRQGVVRGTPGVRHPCVTPKIYYRRPKCASMGTSWGGLGAIFDNFYRSRAIHSSFLALAVIFGSLFA